MKRLLIIFAIALFGACAKKQTNKLIATKLSTSGIITTIAGNGIKGYKGIGDSATKAEITNPYYLATDNLGNIYFTEASETPGNNDNAVLKISNTSIISNLSTGSLLQGIAVDRGGDVYVVGEAAISRINSSGGITTIAGNGTRGFRGDGGQATIAELNLPTGIAIDSAGNIYFSDQFNNRIRKINTSGIITTIAGGGINGNIGVATSASLTQPTAIAIDNYGNLYFTQVDNVGLSTFILKLNSSGIISLFAGNYTKGYSGDGGQATVAELGSVAGIAVDNLANIYIADVIDNVVRKVNPEGIISTYVGNGYGANTSTGGYTGDGGQATAAELWSPDGVAVDQNGNVFISDAGNNVIRKVSN